MNTRRQVLSAGLLAVCWQAAHATPDAMQASILALTRGAALRTGRVQIDISPLVENGNAVPVSLSVAGAAPGQVLRLALFTERNPQPEVAVFQLGSLAARAQVSTRIRLATSQTLVALAEMADGSFWQQRVEVVVTLAACVEGG